MSVNMNGPIDERLEEMKAKARRDVYETAIGLWKSGLIAASSGNVSARIPGTDLAAITPSGIRYDKLRPEDIVMIDIFGNPQEPDKKPSTEMPIHTLIYREKRGINAVVHTHSTYALVFATLGETIPMISIEGLMVGKAMLPVTKSFQLPGSDEFTDEVMEVLDRDPELRAVLLASHGLLVIGQNLDEAQSLAESVEIEAKVYHQARMLGMPSIISEGKRTKIARRYGK